MSRLRVMTYNIHGGRGMDDRIDLERIATVIRSFDPDIVALQEVDVNRSRSGVVDQAQVLGTLLSLTVQFGPTIERATERYGIATLTRLPITRTYQLHLPWRETNPRSEPRCALVTRLDWNGIAVDMINTHLSVRFGERQGQVAEILKALASDDIPDVENLIIAGDFNCTPWSRPFRTLARQLRPIASPLSWPAPLPLVPLDHILIRGDLRVVRSGLWRGPLIRRASDHAPVFAELALAHAPVAA
jgi:endonuclease/exonuclease/phosphatase family metal-dependent hydrolase